MDLSFCVGFLCLSVCSVYVSDPSLVCMCVCGSLIMCYSRRLEKNISFKRLLNGSLLE